MTHPQLCLDSDLLLNLWDVEWVVGTRDNSLYDLPCQSMQFGEWVMSRGFLEGDSGVCYLALQDPPNPAIGERHPLRYRFDTAVILLVKPLDLAKSAGLLQLESLNLCSKAKDFRGARWTF